MTDQVRALLLEYRAVLESRAWQADPLQENKAIWIGVRTKLAEIDAVLAQLVARDTPRHNICKAHRVDWCEICLTDEAQNFDTRESAVPPSDYLQTLKTIRDLAAIHEGTAINAVWRLADRAIEGDPRLLNEGTPTENLMRFCCYCGRKLKQCAQAEGKPSA